MPSARASVANATPESRPVKRIVELREGRSLVLGAGPLVMGIVNVTPDSFSDGGAHVDPMQARDAALAMIAEGASIIDVGGESTRPGAEPVDGGIELQRVLPVIAALRRASRDVAISVDTTKASVAQAAIDAGADIVNDISALRFDDDLARVVASSRAAVILMHMRGAPATMQNDIRFDDVVSEVRDEIEARVAFAVSAGIENGKILIDPGIGFGKTSEQNVELLACVASFTAVAPVVIGASRKKFLGHLTGRENPRERLAGSLAAAAAASEGGAAILRVHDVRETVDFLKVRHAIRSAARR